MKYLRQLIIFSFIFLAYVPASDAQYLTKALRGDYSLDSLSAKDHYEYVQLVNSYGKTVSQRNRKTHRLDSVYRYSTRNATQPLDIIGRSLYEYSDTLLIERASVLLYDIASHVDGRWQGSNFDRYKLNPVTGQLNELTRQWLPRDESTLDSLPLTYRLKYSYNSHGLLDTLDESRELFIPIDAVSSRFTYQYDGLNRLTDSYVFTYAFPDTLILDRFFQYGYDTDDRLQFHNYYSVSSIDGSNIKIDSTHYHYDEQGYLVREEYFTGIRDFPSTEYDYTNSASGQPDTVVVKSWNSTGEYLRYNSEESYQLQESGDLGNMTAVAWRNGQYVGTAYGSRRDNDPDISNEQVIYPVPYAYNSKYNNMILSESSFNDYFFVGQYFIDHTERPYGISYFYTNLDESSTVDHPDNNLKIKAVPNPATEELSFIVSDFAQQQDCHLKIYDLAGHLVSSAQHNWRESYSIADLEAGIYFFQIEQAGKVGVGRFVKL